METMHDVQDPGKVQRLADSMRRDGWVGAPIVAFDDLAITGVHRLAACEIAGVEPETITIQAVCEQDGVAWADWLAVYDQYADWTVGVAEACKLLSPGTQVQYGVDCT